MAGIRPGYVYVLHFDTKLHHAEHYIGSTHEIRERLTCHANGAGSRLTQVLAEQGIEWRLGALGSVSHAGLRRLERKLKDHHNSRRYCVICNKSDAKKIPGTTPYPIEGLPFATDSMSLRGGSRRKLPETLITWPNTQEGELIIGEIVTLMGIDRDALGFIPAGGNQGMIELCKGQSLCIAKKGNALVGYCACTINKEWVNIQQCCVNDKYRLCGIGRRMVEAAAQKWPEKGMRAIVRDDLAANMFWEQIGFNLVDSKRHKTSKSILNVYECEPMLPQPDKDWSNGEQITDYELNPEWRIPEKTTPEEYCDEYGSDEIPL